MELPLSDSFKIIERLSGHIPKMGKSAGQELNWAYLLLDTKTSEEYIGMFCKPNHITLIDKEIWDKLHEKDNVNITWYLAHNGYISRTVKKEDDIPFTYLHQFITGHSGNGKGQDSIDHINQNKLDNRKINLRIVKQGEQNKNRGKVARHSNAKELPKELEGVTLPKFCVYYEDYKKNEKGEKVLLRNFFTIEGHPNQEGKRKATSKSSKKTILEKFEEAIDILTELDTKNLTADELNDKVWCKLCDQAFIDEDDRKLKIEKTESSEKKCYYCSTCYEIRGNTSLEYFLDHIKKIYNNISLVNS
jgi:hypothetical protein